MSDDCDCIVCTLVNEAIEYIKSDGKSEDACECAICRATLYVTGRITVLIGGTDSKVCGDCYNGVMDTLEGK